MKVCYNDIIDYYRIYLMYQEIVRGTKNKQKLVKFELYKVAYLTHIYDLLEEEKYIHGRYNIFLIKVPKYRVIMSENLQDKIVNHLVSYFILMPVIEKRLIEANVATRLSKGLDGGLRYLKSYLNKMRYNFANYYVLKCDVNKYFYNIDHNIIFQKLSKIFDDEKVLHLLHTIVDSTDCEYVNKEISLLIKEEDDKGHKAAFKSIPLYRKGKGLPIGNMTSQILAIFYLNDLDHYIKEVLKIKYYVRYMDDFFLFHENKEYLRYCQQEIVHKLAELQLTLNKKTAIFKLTQGFNFLGYHFKFAGKRFYMLPSHLIKRKIRRRYKKDGKIILKKYHGYLLRCHSGSYCHAILSNETVVNEEDINIREVEII